jgi:general secretion pathway protein D
MSDQIPTQVSSNGGPKLGLNSLRVVRSPFLVVAVVILLAFLSTPLHANSDLVHLAEREEIRRQNNLNKAERLILRAERADKDKNYRRAYTEYLEVLSLIPAGTATASDRQTVINSFSKTAVAYARELIERGNFAEAQNVLKTVLSPEFNPTFKPAASLLAQMEQKNFNTTLDPKFAADRNEVEKLLNEAEGFYNTDRFDLAIKRYEQILNLDKYNVAARNGIEKVNIERTDYYNESYNETRSRMLWLVDRAWERPVRKLQNGSRTTETVQFLNESAPTSKDEILKKINTIMLDKVVLDDVTIREAVDFLKQKSRELDLGTPDPKKRGVNIVLKPLTTPTLSADAALPGEDGTPVEPFVTENSRITMSLSNVPLMEAIRYLTELSGLKPKIEPFAVYIVPATENTEDLLVKEYRVSPSFIPASSAQDAQTPRPGMQSTGDSNQRITGERNATEYLKQQGVPFPEGAFAQYIPSGSKLVVRNTQGALDLIDTLVEGDMGSPPNQIEIESKFVEISQTNTNELGFDWLLGPFSIGGGVYGNGGTRSGDEDLGSAYYQNFPFNNTGANPITAGNRSGFGTSPNSAINVNSINALLAGLPQGSNALSPGILGLAGIFTQPQFQMVIRALSQQKGVDLVSAPKVTTKSGNKATIKIIREFPYPDSFDPPSLPQQTSREGQGQQTFPPGALISGGIVTPSSPNNFATKELGVSLEVEPQVGADNFTIDLSLNPQIIDFDGFVNYGSPIFNARFDEKVYLANPLGTGVVQTVATENVINQPIFSVRQVSTNVSIWDGQTVALGGLIREDVQKVNDKVPILGDIPLAGRLFRTNVDQKIKKNLIIFVTARLMDAEGQPLQQFDEAEEIVNPLGLPDDLAQPEVVTTQTGK